MGSQFHRHYLAQHIQSTFCGTFKRGEEQEAFKCAALGQERPEVFHCPEAAASSTGAVGLQLVKSERGAPKAARTHSKQRDPAEHAETPGWRRSQ